MGYWGWRPMALMLCISVWVTGCHIASGYALTSSPTEPPRITLTVRQHATSPPSTPLTAPPAATSPAQTTAIASAGAPVYTVRPGDTLLGIALDFGIEVAQIQAANPGIDPRGLQVGQQLTIPLATLLPPLTSPTMLALHLPPPTCYPLPTGYTLCLGEAQNPHPYPVEGTRLRVQLEDVTRAVLAEQAVGLEQAMIPAGQAAPYAVTFAQEWEDGYTSSATILQAMPQPAQAAERFVPLLVEEAAGELVNGRYVLTATLYNPTSRPTRPALLVLSVRDADQRMAGYRVAGTARGLQPGERLPVTLEVIPQGGAAPFTHSLYVEARAEVQTPG